MPDAKFPIQLWATTPRANMNRTMNGPESFHAHFNEQFYAAQPNIFTFIDVIIKIKTTAYVKMRCMDETAAMRKSEKEKIAFLLQQFAKYLSDQLSHTQSGRLWDKGFQHQQSCELSSVGQ